MKIVVLDGYGLNPGDLSWEGLRKFGSLKIYDRTSADKVLERSAQAGILLTNKTLLTRNMLKALPDLKYVGVLATGYNVIDTAAARELGITVTNIPAYSTNSVAQMTFALILELCLHVQKHSDSVMAGKWADSLDFTYRDYPLIELFSKTIGIIGFGNTGRKVADIATAFGMNIIASTRTQSDQSHRRNFRWAALPELFEQSDIVSIHCPLNPETAGLVNAGNLRRMKNTAFLINTSRGPVVVEKDLADALNEGIIAGAGLDVLAQEPPSHDNPLFKAKNCIIAPHIAWATLEARTRLMELAVTNVEAFLSGSPVNVVN
ncbi:MAG: D-2-hydroxyacid dehydrogenase [Methanococcaceae archaeon]